MFSPGRCGTSSWVRCFGKKSKRNCMSQEPGSREKGFGPKSSSDHSTMSAFKLKSEHITEKPCFKAYAMKWMEGPGVTARERNVGWKPASPPEFGQASS